MSKRNKSRVLEERQTYAGKWIETYEATYQDESGKKRVWESVHRQNRASAAIIIPRLEPSGRYILIKQFRPPVGAYVIEFPAGLIDEGESPEQAAIRELKEETGYKGEFVHSTPPLYTSPGMLSEYCYFVSLSIDENLDVNRSPQAETEPEEHIEVFILSTQGIPAFFNKEVNSGSVLDIKLYTFFKSVLIPEK